MKLQSLRAEIRKTLKNIPVLILWYGKKTVSSRSHAMKSNSLVGKATRYLWKHSWMQFTGISIVIAFLLFFLHLFISTAYITQKVSSDITQKLGFYFYITESGENNNTLKQEEINNRVLSLKNELLLQWLHVEYYSKDDALRLLQERIPGVIQNFERYGIENPLPATMYVTFENNEQYTSLSGIVSKYTDVVRNTESIHTKGGFQEQQQRIANIINITHFSTVFSLILVMVVCVMIVSFLLLIITMKCRQFWKNIEVEKLLGTNYMTIKMPFLISIVMMLCLAFVLTGCLVAIISHYIGNSFSYLFHTSLADYVRTMGGRKMIGMVIIEFILLTFIATSMSDRVLTRMIKQI